MHLDTHAVIWLYQGHLHEFSPHGRRLLDSEPLVVSPMVLVELDLLHEIGRTEGPAAQVVTELEQTVGLTVGAASFAAVAAHATALVWTRDPFDRLICAHALTDGQILLTKDRKIRNHFPPARWDE